MKVYIEGAATVTIERSSRARRMRITVSPHDVRVVVPKGVSLETGRAFALSRTQWIRKHLEKMEQREKAHEELLRNLPPITDTNKAKQKIISRCRELAGITGLSCGRVVIRNQKTRWGSCSSKGTISLNIKLVRLPRELMDYVILHELVHTRVKGHGRAFWDMMDTLIDNARSLRGQLRQYILRLL